MKAKFMGDVYDAVAYLSGKAIQTVYDRTAWDVIKEAVGEKPTEAEITQAATADPGDTNEADTKVVADTGGDGDGEQSKTTPAKPKRKAKPRKRKVDKDGS